MVKLGTQIDFKTNFKMWWKWLASGNFKLDYVSAAISVGLACTRDGTEALVGCTRMQMFLCIFGRPSQQKRKGRVEKKRG